MWDQPVRTSYARTCRMIGDARATRRPDWAAAGSFAQAWRTAAHASHRAGSEFGRALNSMVLTGLSIAHVVTIDADQVRALPTTFDSYADSAAAFLDARLPFDPVYLSLGDVPLEKFAAVESQRPLLSGALVGVPDNGPGDWDGVQPHIFPYVLVPDSTGAAPPIAMFDRFIFASDHGWLSRGIMDDLCERVGLPDGITPADVQDGGTMGADAAEIVGAVLYFLASANVEMVDAPASRQERRAAIRRGGQVALTVQVRQPKRRLHDAEGERRRIDYSHRFEVRGHYKHFPAGTRAADAAPDKMVDHPTLGRCRRIWCPPHVKGPQDKPLVPKVRTVQSEGTAA